MLWRPADIQALPHGHDINHALGAIEQLKKEIEEVVYAGGDPRGLFGDIEELQAWISPMRRLPFEIISEIMVMSAQLVWWSPALLSRVCRFWRDVAIATPRAWSLMDLRSEPSCKFASLFFERSSPCRLHFAVLGISPASQMCYVDLFRRFSERIECLVLTQDSKELIRGEYKNLTRLSINYPLTYIPLDYLAIKWFPNLQFVDSGFSLHGIPDFMAVPSWKAPPILHLVVKTDFHSAWVAAIRMCAKTLRTLHVHVSHKGEGRGHPGFELPELFHLAITTEVNRHVPWHFTAKTPSLKTFYTIEGDGIYSSAIDVRTITHLRSWEPISLARYTELRRLHVYGYSIDPCPTISFVEELCETYHTCPHLEAIVTSAWDVLDIEQITQTLIKRNRYTGVNLRILPGGYPNDGWPDPTHLSVRGTD